MNKFDKNFLLAKFIAENKVETSERTVLTIPNSLYHYDTSIELKEGNKIPITELNFNEDWNLIMLVAKKVCDVYQEKIRILYQRNTDIGRILSFEIKILEGKIDLIMATIGLFDLEQIFEFLVEEVKYLNK